jgi:type II secretory pathway pseudopilin PulG
MATAFTLVELLVVISIIVLLAGLLLVAVNRVFRQGSDTRAAADLASIATALEAYKQDFGDYPRVTQTNTGAAVLCKALIGPSPHAPLSGARNAGQFLAVPAGTINITYLSMIDNNSTTPPGSNDDWVRFDVLDGADGQVDSGGKRIGQNGFRTGPKTIDDNDDGIPDRPGGKVWGPYLQPEKFLTKPDIGVLLDFRGNPILYFPAKEAANVAQPNGYVSNGNTPRYDINNGYRYFFHPGETGATANLNALARIQVMFGDVGCNGALDTQFGVAESDGATGVPYVLYSAGADGVFGPPTDAARGKPIVVNPTDNATVKQNAAARQVCDDVVNFR